MTEHWRQKNPNPQGKGLVPVLEDIGALPSRYGGQKTPADFFREYCLATLVLGARFQFKPVPGKTYYLYSQTDGWQLSLVGPQEWRGRAPGTFVARCTLQRDMTWTVDFAELELDCPAQRQLEGHITAFIETLHQQDDVAANLPFYAESLPYYQRVMATGLAASLRHSMPAPAALELALEQLADATLLLENAAR